MVALEYNATPCEFCLTSTVKEVRKLPYKTGKIIMADYTCYRCYKRDYARSRKHIIKQRRGQTRQINSHGYQSIQKPLAKDYTDRATYVKMYGRWRRYWELTDPRVIETQSKSYNTKVDMTSFYETNQKEKFKFKITPKPKPTRPKRWFELLPPPPASFL